MPSLRDSPPIPTLTRQLRAGLMNAAPSGLGRGVPYLTAFPFLKCWSSGIAVPRLWLHYPFLPSLVESAGTPCSSLICAIPLDYDLEMLSMERSECKP